MVCTMPTGEAPLCSGSPQRKTDCPSDRSELRAGKGWLRDPVLRDERENDTAPSRHGVGCQCIHLLLCQRLAPMKHITSSIIKSVPFILQMPEFIARQNTSNAVSSFSPRQTSNRVSSFRSFAIPTRLILNLCSELLYEIPLRRTPIFILGERFNRRKRQNHLGEPIRIHERKIKDPNRESIDGFFDRQLPGTFTQCTQELSRECSVISLLDLAAEVLP